MSEKILKEIKVRVWKQKNSTAKGKFETYTVHNISTDTSFLEMLDILNMQLVEEGKEPIVFDHDCREGICGTCSLFINGRAHGPDDDITTCQLHMRKFKDGETITVEPFRVGAFPVIKDLVTDVSWNYAQNKKIAPFKPGEKGPDGNYRMMQRDVDRVQEFRKCIECYLCQNVCHVLRDHGKKDKFVGPRFMIRLASLAMHPLDTEDRIPKVREEYGSGLCNITKCCTEVCPEHIHITDNGIIPLKERVVDRYYDPILWLWRLTGSIWEKIFEKNK